MRAVEGLLLLVAVLTVLAVVAVAAACALIVFGSDRFPPKPSATPQTAKYDGLRPVGWDTWSTLSEGEGRTLVHFYPNWPEED